MIDRIKIFRQSKFKKLLIVFICVSLIFCGGYYIFRRVRSKSTEANNIQTATAQVVRGDISVAISGTGTVAPMARYDIIPLVRGNVLNAPFEEGMEVKKGDLLYRIDDSDMLINIERTRNNIEQLNLNHKSTLENIKNLVVYAPCDGRITNLTVREGDQVGAGKIADIIDDSKLVAVVSFNASQIDKISIGLDAQLVIPEYMMYIDGKVAYKSTSGRPSSEGTILYDVEIHADNPGAVVSGATVTGIVKSFEGDIISPVAGKVEYAEDQPLRVKTSGTVSKIYVRENEVVNKGQKILELENDSLISAKEKYDMDLKDLQYTLDSQMKELENYNIISPIDGVVIMKDAKVGDTVNNQSGNVILMTVADMSKMVFELAVDELDIAKVKVGQLASIEADALPNEKFEGRVTNISLEGNSQNGVTTYTVEITIDEPGNLKPGMNVNAEIMVEHKNDILYLPMAAITMIRNNAYVYLDSNDAQEAGQFGRRISEDTENNEGVAGNAGEGESPNFKMTDKERKQLEEKASENIPEQQGKRRAPTGGGGVQQPNIQKDSKKQQEGVEEQPEIIKTNDSRLMKRVEVGINNEDYIEIVSGLQEGDTVILPYTVPQMSNMPGNNIRMPGGGMPRGGVAVPAGGMRIRR